MSTVDPTIAESVHALSLAAPDDVGSMRRRTFLQAMAAGVGASMLPGWLDGVAGAASPLGADQGVLVLVVLDGGADALDMVVPISNGTYYSRRGGIAVPASSTHHITGSRGFHPNLRHVRARWGLGEVAVIDGVGNPKADLSHFSAMADVQHGGPSSGVPTTGWLGRYLDGIGADPLQGVAIDQRTPLALVGHTTRGTVLPGDPAFVRPAKDHNRSVDAALAAMGSGASGLGELADLLADTGAGMMGVAGTIRPLYGSSSGPDLARRMALAASLVNADLGVRVVTVRHAGYDSHAGQPQMFGARMAELDAGLRAFYETLAPAFATRTTILCMSEFGRRVRANGSAGTDHGAGQSLLAIGGAVRGGFYGAVPSLTDLTREGNLKGAVDYRNVLGTVLSRWLGADEQQVLGVATADLGFVNRPGRSSGGTINPHPFRPAHADVLRLYRAFFRRDADVRGGQYWIDVYERGSSLDTIAEWFTKSSEFETWYGGTRNADYVYRVYGNVLGRKPDETGYRYWLGMLDSGRLTRGTVVRWMAANAEFAGRWPYTCIP